MIIDGFRRINKLNTAIVVPKCNIVLHTSSFVVFLLALLLIETWPQLFESGVTFGPIGRWKYTGSLESAEE